MKQEPDHWHNESTESSYRDKYLSNFAAKVHFETRYHVFSRPSSIYGKEKMIKCELLKCWQITKTSHLQISDDIILLPTLM